MVFADDELAGAGEGDDLGWYVLVDEGAVSELPITVPAPGPDGAVGFDCH